jgi:hypothetical protein
VAPAPYRCRLSRLKALMKPAFEVKSRMMKATSRPASPIQRAHFWNVA